MDGGDGSPPARRGDRRAESRLAGASPCVPASQKRPRALTRQPYQNRHRWEGTSIPRRAGETSLRNSATWPRNFGRRGPSGQCLEAQRNGPCDCLTKTQHSANSWRGSIECDT